VIGQIVEVVETDRHLSLEYGSMLVHSREGLLARIALDDILAVIINPHGATMSAGILAALAERNCPVVIAGKDFKPTAILMPLVGNFEVAARIEAQVRASLPAKKQAWKQIVQSKITMQALALETVGGDSAKLRELIPTVRSGDVQNVEAQAARYYWRQMFGDGFRRERDDPGINALLNYGYAIVRAATARAIAASGLHPSIGIHHINPLDTMRLADDLMEPYRPLVDIRVHGIADDYPLDVVPETKKMLVAILSTDFPTEAGSSPVSVAMHRTAQSLVKYFKGERDTLELPGESARPVFVDLAEAFL
jgi:CRISPR-associated protein Cas1